MNKRTAALVLNTNLIVLACQFQNDIMSGNPRRYTYVSDASWLNLENLVNGDRLIAQAKEEGHVCTVIFREMLEVTDLDLDADFKYKFVLGAVPPEYFDRMNEAEAQIKETLAGIKKQRINALRQAVYGTLIEDASKEIKI